MLSLNHYFILFLVKLLCVHYWNIILKSTYKFGRKHGRTCPYNTSKVVHSSHYIHSLFLCKCTLLGNGRYKSNRQHPLRSTMLRCQTQLSEVLLSQVKSRLFSVPNPVRDNPCYSLLLAVHPFLLANLWHLPPFGECSRESSKA